VLLKEYLVLLTQLDTEFVKGNLTLQKLWFYIQQSMRMMENMNKLAIEASDKKGGALLNAIYKFQTITSDKSIKELFSFLLEKASEPFHKILLKWIHLGVLDDPFEEFLVKEDPSMNKDNIEKDFNDSYWQKRFTFREDMIPIYFQKQSIKILHTGKYLNVIRECGKDTQHPEMTQRKDFSELIEEAHEWSSKRLLDLFFIEERLLDRLKSIKHYFFLDLGDFFLHFFDGADIYLEALTKEVSNDKLKSLLELAIRTSTANMDPFKDDLTCELNNYSLVEQIFVMQNIRGALGSNAYAPDATGSGQSRPNFSSVPISGMNSMQNYKCVDSFTLDYKVQWPLTLIISRRAITKYQLIFRHLFFCKYVERHLGNTWLLHQSTKELNLDGCFLNSYNLRHRMHHFCKNYVYYIVVEVLDPNFYKFKENLSKVKTVDEILELHNTFLDECLKECLLTDQNLLKILIKIFNCCFFLSRIIHRYTNSIQEEEAVLNARSMVMREKNDAANTYAQYRQQRINAESQATKRTVTEKSYKNMIEKFSNTFDTHLKQFMNAIKSSHYDPYIANLLMRLDFNGYYAENLLSQFEGFGGPNSFAPSESVNMTNSFSTNMR
jgi:gamma-tubulin complex component 2